MKIKAQKSQMGVNQTVPTMTSDTAPAGYKATASSVYSSSYKAYMAFGVESSYGWCPSSSGSSWIKVELPEAKALAIGWAMHVGSATHTVTISGSNDDVTYNTLTTVTLPGTSRSKAIFVIDNSKLKDYKYYKFSGSFGTSGYGYKFGLYNVL